MTNPDPVVIRPKKVSFGPFIAVLSVIFFVAVAIFCTYLIVKGQIDAQAHATAVAQVKSSIGECKALITLDHAGKGIVFPKINAAHPSEEALTRLFAGIHGVVAQSHCQELLTLVKHHGINGAAQILFAHK